MERLREAWHNDVMLSMGSAFCVGLGAGVFACAFFLPVLWMLVPMTITLVLFFVGFGLLSRADRLRQDRWQRQDWR